MILDGHRDLPRPFGRHHIAEARLRDLRRWTGRRDSDGPDGTRQHVSASSIELHSKADMDGAHFDEAASECRAGQAHRREFAKELTAAHQDFALSRGDDDDLVGAVPREDGQAVARSQKIQVQALAPHD